MGKGIDNKEEMWENIVLDREPFESPIQEGIWLNNCAQERWELVAIMPYAPCDGAKTRYYFKRRLQ